MPRRGSATRLGLEDHRVQRPSRTHGRHHMARTTLHDEIQHDGGANAFVARQAENLRHWAAPKVESTRAWSEVAAAYGLIGGSAAAEEGRRKAQDAKKEYGPVVERGARKAGEAVAHAGCSPSVSRS